MSLRYQFDPPSSDFVASLQVKDLDSNTNNDTLSSWGSSTATASPVYKNDSSFPFVQLNGGYFTLGQKTISPADGFTFMGLVFTTAVDVQFPLVWSYAEGADDGLRLYRTGGGQDLVFRSQKAASIEARADDTTSVNTWQVFTCRVKNNGDSTITMEIFVDNVLQGSVSSASSNMSGVVSGLLEVGQSTAWTGQPVSPIYISDCFFYDRDLSDTEVADMHTYFNTMGNEYIPPIRLFNQLQIVSTSEYLGTSEIEIYTTSGTNIALLGTASGDARNPENINDGDNDPSTWASYYLQGGNPTLILDFDKGYTLRELNKVVFYGRTGVDVVFTRKVGSIISLHSADGMSPEQIGVLTDDLIQEFVINELALTVTPRVTSVTCTVVPIDGATAYRLTYQKTGSTREVVAVRNFTDLSQAITNLVPETEYTVRLYYTTGTIFTLEGESVSTTLANSAENYNVTEFLNPNGRFDISSLNNDSIGLISNVMNDLFTTDDVIDINISGKKRTSKFVNRGGVVDITGSDALVAPFSSDGGPGQAISMTLSDSSSVAVSYDETTEAVMVGGNTYDTGESLVLDGKKVTIVDI